MHQCYLAQKEWIEFLENVDEEFADNARAAGCSRCGCKLHRDNYPRKPRGGPEDWDRRLSFTCAVFRHRNTPASVRFLGPKVYIAVVVLLVPALTYGISPQTAQCLKAHIQVDRRTLNRWRRWWRETFVESAFWRMAQAEFSPPIDASTLPASLCGRFEPEGEEGVLNLLRWLAPITVRGETLKGSSAAM